MAPNKKSTSKKNAAKKTASKGNTPKKAATAKKEAQKSGPTKNSAGAAKISVALVKSKLRAAEKALNDPIIRNAGGGGNRPTERAVMAGGGGQGGDPGQIKLWITYCYTEKHPIGSASQDFNEVESNTQDHIQTTNPNHNAKTIPSI
ncbi:MAG: hypothetical protein P4L51_01880 [Puia sp.]|nr:hypothetical protein [Puia sp.]